MKKILFLTILFLTSKLYADEPPSYEPYFLESENKEYFAFINFADQDSLKYPWERKWMLGVFHQDSTLFWKREFHPSGYKGGKLTNDGLNIVFVNFWYYDKGWAVWTLHKNPKNDICIQGKEFKIPKEYLEETSSHYLWRKDYELKDNKIYITTNDENIWEVNLDTKKLILIHHQQNNFLIKILIISSVILVGIIAFISIRKRKIKRKF
jgi:hypothetical protein